MLRSLSHLLLAFSILYFAEGSRAGERAAACVRRKDAVVRLDKEMIRGASTPTKIIKNRPKSGSGSLDQNISGSQISRASMKLRQFTPVNWTGEREGSWLQVQTFDDKLFWIREQDLSFRWTCLQVIASQTRMRSGPGSHFPKVGIAGQGDVFRDLGGEDGWTRVKNTDGRIHWIYLDHTWKPTSKMRMSFQPDKNE